jgi:hypothetical protein
LKLSALWPILQFVFCPALVTTILLSLTSSSILDYWYMRYLVVFVPLASLSITGFLSF